MKNIFLKNKIVTLSFLIGIFSLVSFTVSAQQLNSEDDLNDTKSRAQTWANETSIIAGGAIFCKIDPELIESYITRAQTRIASEARGEVELVVARIAFSNGQNTASIVEPVGGCEDFAERFARESVRLD